MDNFDTDVIVVGAGPMGATTALSLASQGVRVLAINKYSWVSRTPRAHITNQRAMEVLRALGIEDRVVREALPWEEMGDISFSTSFAGEEVARVRAWGSGETRKGDYLAASPCTMLDIPQSLLEPILIDEASRRGAMFAFNTEYLSHVQDEDGVTVRMCNRVSGEEFEQRARYLVGADGARSMVLNDAGLGVEGLPPRDGTIYVEFSADLTRYVQHRPSSLHWILSQKVGNGELGMALLRAIRPWNHWIAGWGFDAADDEPDLSEEAVLARLRDLVGDPDVDIGILGVSTWFVNELYAPIYSNGRVFCGGDAVHRHPPSGGLGSNTCLQDAFNLAWKLAYVIKGYASPQLLETYTAERAPVGKQVVTRANGFRGDYAPMLKVLFGGGGPQGLARGLATLKGATPEGAAARSSLERALARKDIEYNGHGTQMDLRYRSSAVISDGDEWADEADEGLFAHATSRPGAKVPHAWVVDHEGRRTSTLDVASADSFTLLIGLGGNVWAEAAEAVDAPYLHTVVIGGDSVKDLYFEWHRVREVADNGAILVRPDGIVAWRSVGSPATVGDATTELRSALGQILGSRVATST